MVDQRRHHVQMVEEMSSLETDLANERSRREKAEKRLVEELARIKTERDEEVDQLKLDKIRLEKRFKSEAEQLDDMVARQRSIISELKCQNHEQSGRFEESYNSWMKEKQFMRSEVDELKCSMLDLGGQVRVLESQNVEHIKLNKSILSQLDRGIQQSEHPTKDFSASGKHLESSQTNKSAKVKGSSSRRKVSAITIERAGKVKHLISSVN